MWETLKPFPLFFGGAQNQPQTRWVYNFNGVDNYIDTGQRIVDVDNLDGLTLEGVFDSSISGAMFAQNISSTAIDREFQIYNFGPGTDTMFLIVGGASVQLLSPANMPSERGLYRFEFVSGNIVRTLFNGALLSSVVYIAGIKREPTATFSIMARGAGAGAVGFLRSGICYNVKINDGTVYNYPINDRTFGLGAVIANTGTGPDATGINLLESGWEEIPIPKTRYAYNFNGVDSYIDVGSIVYTGDYSRSVKFKMPVLSGTSVRLWGKDTSFTSRFLVNDDGSARIRFSDSEAGEFKLPAGTFVTNVTYNVTVSRIGSAAKVTVNSVDFDFTGVDTGQSTFNFIQRMSSTYYGVGMVWDYTDSLGNDYPINDRTFGTGAVIKNVGTGADATGVNLLESGWEEIPL